jgi:sugar phosphate isomerase/epimerase
MRFGLSTHLFHGERLTRRHLERIAARDFSLIEIFATRTHVDYHSAPAIAAVRQWLDELGLTAWSMHAPICDGFTGGEWGRAYSPATTDAVRRQEALDETQAALDAARQLGCAVMVVHLGIPREQPIEPNDNNAGAMRRSLTVLAEASRAAGVRLALEVIPNALATPEALVDWLTGDLELGDAGACLDVGHAHLVGGAPEAAEVLSGHIISTHLHDNRGRSDDHLVPFAGTIDWPATAMALSKVGYAGPLMFELPDHGDADRTLAQAVGARARLQAILDDLSQPLEFEPAE